MTPFDKAHRLVRDLAADFQHQLAMTATPNHALWLQLYPRGRLKRSLEHIDFLSVV